MPEEPSDLRRYAAQTRKRLLLGGLILIVGVGAGLIAVTYGTPAAACGLSVFLLALLPVGLIGAFLLLIQWGIHRMELQDEEPKPEKSK